MSLKKLIDLPDLGDKVATTKTPKPTPSPTPTPDVDGAKKDFNQKFNKKPLQDFADGVLAKLDSTKPEDKVDLTQQLKTNGVKISDELLKNSTAYQNLKKDIVTNLINIAYATENNRNIMLGNVSSELKTLEIIINLKGDGNALLRYMFAYQLTKWQIEWIYHVDYMD